MWMNGLLGLSVATAVLLAQPTPIEESAVTVQGPIVVRNEYWAKKGLEGHVYRHRLYASEVRARLGLYEGRVLRRINSSTEQPDVIWECEYPSLEAREADTRALHATGEFDPVMDKMETLIEKFDRSVWSVQTDAD